MIGFLIMDSNFQDSLYNSCHDLTMLSVNISNIAIITLASLKQLIC